MLLRLLPAPQPRQVAPPTILFTLPLATAPYTAKGLPLPPNLLAHRNACAKEQVDCPNALFGDKATWIAGIVDEVTFAIKEETITILLIDGNRLVLPIERGCLKMLERVMKEVQLSFTASQNPAPKSPALSSVGMSRSGSTSSNSSSSSGMRSPSALLSALLSPIMSSSSSSSSSTASSSRRPPASAANPARTHRRQARSLLVDAYRQFVLPHLKETFPPSFILWSLNSEAATKREEWQVIRTEVDAILSKSGLGKERESSYGSLARDGRGFRSTASFDSYDSSSSASESDSTPPLTPATSIFNSEGRSSLLTCSPILSPLAHLSTLPACSLLPLPYRAGYASAVSTLATLASRLSAITKLITSIEKESNRRRWLDSLEGSRQVEKAGRRSWSNLAWGGGCMQGFNAGLGRPARGSSLRHSFTGEEESENKLVIDQERSLRGRAVDVEDQDDDDIFNSNIIVRPISPLNPSSIFSSNACDSEEIMEPMMITPPSRRRSSLGNVESIDFPSSSHSTSDRMTNRRPSLEAMELLNNYRIVSASSMDGEDEQNEDGCGLRNSILEIPPKSGESGFRVGLSIVR